MLDYPAACKYFQHDLPCIHNVRPYRDIMAIRHHACDVWCTKNEGTVCD